MLLINDRETNFCKPLVGGIKNKNAGYHPAINSFP
jgi:hypothetical protein